MERPYTKSQITSMDTDFLRKIAVNTGVEGAEEWTRDELIEYLVTIFGFTDN